MVKATPSSLLKKSLVPKRTLVMITTLYTFPQSEEEEQKSVLKRSENDAPLVKGNSGYRASPRISPQIAPPSPIKETSEVPETAKASPRTSPRASPEKETKATP